MGSPRQVTEADALPVLVRMYQAQDRLGVSDDTLRRWERQGLIKLVRRGRMTAVRTADVLKVMGG